MAQSGGATPGFWFCFYNFQRTLEKGNRFIICCPSYLEVWLNFVSNPGLLKRESLFFSIERLDDSDLRCLSPPRLQLPGAVI